MVHTCDPPNYERKRSVFWKRVRGFGRNLVNRQTFMIAMRLIVLVERIAKLLNRLFGDF
ncbi:hypothetical protein [Bradyrhizobium ottawaense]|uniref:hypothetical protein n=1 Tax=Bradyrhizobium ottawaense TaxID=931866 RepID=UPI0017F3B9D5|nr:hypothetical protein [Bradyrhizobium sp. ERR14]